MPPGPGGGGGGGGGVGGARRGGGGGRTPANVREGSEDIRKFLSFYKRRNSLCIDLYLPAFYQKKLSYDDLADLVYSVLSVGGTSPPQVIRAGVQDIQLHPVKKLLFIKFTEQQLRDEVVTRLQAGLLWPAFNTTVTGWSMDKPVERVRVLGTSPESDEGGIRRVLGQYGEVLDAQKGYISRKLPGCTNGIWTVRLILRAGISLPPFLIMKDEGEVWQLATGETSVCWKCGQGGHIGDKCRQDVNILAQSIASPAVGDQPSWAHVVKGGVSVVPQAPPLPPRVLADPHLFRNPFKATSVILKAAKNALKAVPMPSSTGQETVPVPPVIPAHPAGIAPISVLQVTPVPAATSPVLETASAASMVVQFSAEEDILPASQSYPKKAKLSAGVMLPRDPRLRGKVPALLSSSPELPHKVSGGELRHGLLGKELYLHCGPVEGDMQHVEGELHGGPVEGVLRHDQAGGSGEEVKGVEKSTETSEDGREKTNLYGMNYLLWFELGIEGKDSMDPSEDDWGGRIEFAFSEKKFDRDFEEYFILFEDQCTLSHNCAGRVSGLQAHLRNKVLEPPSYDPRNIVELIEKYGDAHRSDTGWREIDPEEWYEDS